MRSPLHAASAALAHDGGAWFLNQVGHGRGRKRVTHAERVMVRDSVTELDATARGRVVLAPSHGGRYAASLAAGFGAAAVILSDAGIGRNRAGLAGLDLLDALGVPAAAVDVWTARIADGKDCLRRGLLSTVNARAGALGLGAGMAVADALALLAAAALPPSPAPPVLAEARRVIAEAGAGGVRVLALDSNALVRPEDAGQVIVTGSHGGLLGGRPETAVKVAVFAALYNDAGIGIDDAGIGRLPALDARGIAGATVSAASAEIGDAASTYRDGIVSAVNGVAARLGGAVGQSARDIVAHFVEARGRELAG
jgi:hypothetical protein